jgi:hypothetical protein
VQIRVLSLIPFFVSKDHTQNTPTLNHLRFQTITAARHINKPSQIASILSSVPSSQEKPAYPTPESSP